MRVPRDCVGTLGREFVYRSLRTLNCRQAIRQARIVAFEDLANVSQNAVFRSVVDLQAAINRFIGEQAPEPFVWRADPDSIIAARNRGFQATFPA